MSILYIKTANLKIPITNLHEVDETFDQLYYHHEIDYLSFSGGGDPLFNICNDDVRKYWYDSIMLKCSHGYIDTELHTSYTPSSFDSWTEDFVSVFDTVSFHLNTLDQIDDVNAGKYLDFQTTRIVFVVTSDFTEDTIDTIYSKFVHSRNVNQLSFRQLINPDYSIDHTLGSYLKKYHKDRWYYIQQGDYNKYIVNDRIYDKFEDLRVNE